MEDSAELVGLLTCCTLRLHSWRCEKWRSGINLHCISSQSFIYFCDLHPGFFPVFLKEQHSQCHRGKAEPQAAFQVFPLVFHFGGGGVQKKTACH